MTDIFPGWADDAEQRPRPTRRELREGRAAGGHHDDGGTRHNDDGGARHDDDGQHDHNRHDDGHNSHNHNSPDDRPRKRDKSRRGRTAVALVILLLLLGLLVLAVVFAWQARAAYTELREAMPQVNELRDQALAGDSDAAAATAAELQDSTGSARASLSGPHWSLAEKLPWLGPNVQAARTATVVVDDLATGALPHLVAATDVVNPAAMAPRDGRIDLAPFIEVAPRITTAHESVVAAQERLGTVETAEVHEILRGELTDLDAQLTELAGLTDTASRAVQLIPPMLGAEEPREYLLMVQNNSEPRSTGGLTGAFILLRADDGALELVEQRSAGEVGYFPELVEELSDPEVALFGTQLARYPGNITSTPDFPRSAQLVREMWRQGVGDEVDGVMSIDPVALGSLLEATGPIDVPEEALTAVGVPAALFDGAPQLTADNAAGLMLNGVYRYIEDPEDQDTFFELVAATIFSRVVSGAGDPAAAVDALMDAAEEGRLMAWSAVDAEQEVLGGTALAGELRGDDGEGAPVVGVYVNDVSAAKIAYYQHMDVELTAHACHPDGSQDLTVAVSLTSEVPDDAASLPDTLAGAGEIVPKGHMASNLLVYAPTGGRITEVRASDGETGVLPHRHEDLAVVARRVDLPAQESVTLEYDITTGPGYSADALLRTTPGPGGEKFTTSALTCDP